MKHVLLGALSLTWLAAPAFAGAVYVPHAANVTVGGIQYQTQVWASNRGDERRKFKTYFVAAGQDGTRREGASYNTVNVSPATTVLLTGVAPAGQTGMLEVNGAPQVAISARIVPVGNPAGRLGANLPVISSESVLAGGTTTHLQGLARGAGLVTDVVVVNLAQQPTACTMMRIGVNGAVLGAPVQRTLAPLSFNRAADFLADLGGGTASGVRVTVSCNRRFYAYALSFDARNAGITVIHPSVLLASNTALPSSELSSTEILAEGRR